MKENFSHASKFVIFWEKYKSDDPKDPGGLTIWGWCKRYHPKEVETMLTMTPEKAKEFAITMYKLKFWDAINGDNLPDLLDIVLMDIAVNQGIGRAKEVQLAAYDWRDAIILRSDKYDEHKQYDDYGRGWNKRIVSLRDYIASNFRILEWDRKELIKAER